MTYPLVLTTPRALGCKQGHVHAARTLVEAGAQRKVRNKDGDSPFSVAVRGQHEEVVGVLLGADGGDGRSMAGGRPCC